MEPDSSSDPAQTLTTRPRGEVRIACGTFISLYSRNAVARSGLTSRVSKSTLWLRKYDMSGLADRSINTTRNLEVSTFWIADCQTGHVLAQYGHVSLKASSRVDRDSPLKCSWARSPFSRYPSSAGRRVFTPAWLNRSIWLRSVRLSRSKIQLTVEIPRISKSALNGLAADAHPFRVNLTGLSLAADEDHVKQIFIGKAPRAGEKLRVNSSTALARYWE